MRRDFMAPYRVGRTGNAELDDALARIEDIRQSLNQARGAIEDGGRDDVDPVAREIDRALVRLAEAIITPPSEGRYALDSQGRLAVPLTKI